MKKYENFDLTYVTVDSLSEGVGSSQITPLISRLSQSGLKIHLISYEKFNPSVEILNYFESIGVNWNYRPFGSSGVLGGIARLNSLRSEISKTNLIHARSDIPTVSAVASHQAPVLWDVRSLWADQKLMIQKNLLNKSMYRIYGAVGHGRAVTALEWRRHHRVAVGYLSAEVVAKVFSELGIRVVDAIAVVLRCDACKRLALVTISREVGLGHVAKDAGEAGGHVCFFLEVGRSDENIGYLWSTYLGHLLCADDEYDL